MLGPGSSRDVDVELHDLLLDADEDEDALAEISCAESVANSTYDDPLTHIFWTVLRSSGNIRDNVSEIRSGG